MLHLPPHQLTKPPPHIRHVHVVLPTVQHPRVQREPAVSHRLVPSAATTISPGRKRVREGLVVLAQVRPEALDLDDLEQLRGQGGEVVVAAAAVGGGRLLLLLLELLLELGQTRPVRVRQLVVLPRRAEGAGALEAPVADAPGPGL